MTFQKIFFLTVFAGVFFAIGRLSSRLGPDNFNTVAEEVPLKNPAQASVTAQSNNAAPQANAPVQSQPKLNSPTLTLTAEQAKEVTFKNFLKQASELKSRPNYKDNALFQTQYEGLLIEAAKVRSDNVDELADLALQMSGTSRKQETLEVAKECLRIDPKRGSCLYVGAYSQPTDSPEKSEAIQSCLDAQPKQMGCLGLRGDELRGKGQYAKSVELYKFMLQVDPTDTYAMLDLGKSYLALGSTKAGLDYLSRSCKSNNKFACEDLKKNQAVSGEP